MLGAVARCVIDGGDVYTIGKGDNPDTAEVEAYSLNLKPVGENKLATVEAKENPTAADFLNVFERPQRQAILNALNLMDRVEAVVEAIPEEGIDGQEPDYNRSVCIYSALYHHGHAKNAAPLAGDQAVAVTDLLGTIASQFFKSIREKAERWHFKIETRPAGE